MSLFPTAIFRSLFTVHFLFKRHYLRSCNSIFLSLKMNRPQRPENFNDLPVEERTKIILEEIKKLRMVKLITLTQ